jgi:hypothetical protein
MKELLARMEKLTNSEGLLVQAQTLTEAKSTGQTVQTLQQSLDDLQLNLSEVHKAVYYF